MNLSYILQTLKTILIFLMVRSTFAIPYSRSRDEFFFPWKMAAVCSHSHWTTVACRPKNLQTLQDFSQTKHPATRIQHVLRALNLTSELIPRPWRYEVLSPWKMVSTYSCSHWPTVGCQHQNLKIWQTSQDLSHTKLPATKTLHALRAPDAISELIPRLWGNEFISHGKWPLFVATHTGQQRRADVKICKLCRIPPKPKLEFPQPWAEEEKHQSHAIPTDLSHVPRAAQHVCSQLQGQSPHPELVSHGSGGDLSAPGAAQTPRNRSELSAHFQQIDGSEDLQCRG